MTGPLEAASRALSQHRRDEFFAKRRAFVAPVVRWAKEVKIKSRGGARQTLIAIARLAWQDANNGGGRWRIEPRVASLAKALRITDRAVKKHTAALEREYLIVRAPIPGRKRTAGRSCYAYYLAVHGADAARRQAVKDGLEPREIDDEDSEPDGERKPAPDGERNDAQMGNQMGNSVPLYYQEENIPPRNSVRRGRRQARQGRSPR